ncbi:MAG: TetR family transcriptional regulator [Gemmatimonadota bacterium]|nr:MAG: TetR family transcriptional regulator [Gemmatimonadota bacterium]
MGRKSEARKKIIDTARELFWKNGYGATGVAQILSHAGIGSGSFYWFFKSKEDLLVAVLEQYLELLDSMIAAPAFKKSTDPIERIFLILEGYRQILEEYDFQLGCPIGNIALELGDKYENVREMTIKNFENWRNMIKKCLHDASNSFPPNTDFDAMTVFILTTMEGAMMQARAHKDISYFDDSIVQLRVYFNSLLTKKEFDS